MIDLLQLLLLLLVLTLLWMQQNSKNFLFASKQQIILDTCALIDGRIVGLVTSGFVFGVLIIPEFILHELQLLADGADIHKRSRARYGLDVVKELQAIDNILIRIDKTVIKDTYAVDDKLVSLAKKTKALLYTTDYNLAKVAQIQSVRVLNVNELAKNLRPTVLPGEERIVNIVQKGNNAKQGAGYLEDGTLVVVENAAQYVGKEVKVEITKAHQTDSGKMLFGELVTSRKYESKSAVSVKTQRSSSARSLASRLKR